jgi:hypothetical protein
MPRLSQIRRPASRLRIAMLIAAGTLLPSVILRAQAPPPEGVPSSVVQPRDPASNPGSMSTQDRIRMRRERFAAERHDEPSSLPPTPPTSATPAANTLPAPIAATPVSGESPSRRPRRAQVTYVDGQLDVRADDSSLNQILRAISRQTGLKITGGVADQRVFGNYGPATTASVLATLLDGTGTNILLLEGDSSTPPELTLTPRGGGPTPPSPSASIFDDTPDPTPAQAPIQQQSTEQPQQNLRQQQPASGPPSIPQPFNNVNGSPLNTSPTASTYPTTNSVPLDTLPTPSTTPSVSGIVDAPNPPAPGSTTGTAPNGTATPDQVYQQLLLMRQKQQLQQQQNAPPAAQTTTPQPTSPQ